MNNLKDTILNKIKMEKVDMKPRWYFLLKSLLFTLGVLTTILLTVYLLSFIFFFLRQSGIGLVPSYGFRGFSLFVTRSPWLLISVVASLIAVVQLLVYRYSVSFKKPLIYSLIAIVFVVLLGSYMIGRTGLHPRLRGLSENRAIPVLGQMYRGINEKKPEHITFGTVEEIIDGGFVVESDKGETVIVLVTPKTKQPPNKIFTTGQSVVVFGDRERDQIVAIGIKPTPPDFDTGAMKRKTMHSMPPFLQKK